MPVRDPGLQMIINGYLEIFIPDNPCLGKNSGRRQQERNGTATSDKIA